jgi:hypothetical protein
VHARQETDHQGEDGAAKGADGQEDDGKVANALKDVVLRCCGDHAKIPFRRADAGNEVAVVESGGQYPLVCSLIRRIEPGGREVMALGGKMIAIRRRGNEYGELDVRALGGDVDGQVGVDDDCECADGEDIQRMRGLRSEVFVEIFRDALLGDEIRIAKGNRIRDILRGAEKGVVRDAADRLDVTGTKIDLLHELDVLRRTRRKVGLRHRLRALLQLA